MRLACLEVWALLAVPLACVYALDPEEMRVVARTEEIVEQEPCTGSPVLLYPVTPLPRK